jgi:hypothetical protein
MRLRCLSPVFGLTATSANMLLKRCASITGRITSGLGRLGRHLFTIGRATARMLFGIWLLALERVGAILERLRDKL